MMKSANDQLLDPPEMNMTPMIDIVFQLIVFFLLTLHFKEVDHRIEAELPKDRGLAATKQIPKPLTTIRVNIFRMNSETPSKDDDFTKIHIGNRFVVELPAGQWAGKGDADAERVRTYDKKFEEVVKAIQTIKAEQPEGTDLKGEIATPPPKGMAVPHGDVVRVLDAFIVRSQVEQAMRRSGEKKAS